MSSSDDSNTHDSVAASASNFHQHFRQRINSLQNQIDSLSAPDVTAESRKVTVESIVAGITKLSATLADASSDLASYDQRSYNQAIRTLQDQLATTQAIHAPKAKFSFKNKKSQTGHDSPSLSALSQRPHLLAASPGPASDIDSTTTSRSVTPAHLRDPEHGTIQADRLIPAIASPATAYSLAPPERLDPQGDESKDSPTVARLALNETVLDPASRNGTYVFIPKLRKRTSTNTPSEAVQTQQHTASQTCVVSDISKSVINLTPPTDFDCPALPSLTLTSLRSSLVIAPSVDGPAHVTGAHDSILVVGCRQFRMHDSRNVSVYLHCSSRPIIEDCTGISFVPLPENFAQGKAVEAKNMYDQVDDFKWLRAEHSPNWRIMPSDEQITDGVWKTVLANIKQLDEYHDDEPSKAAATVRAVLVALGHNTSE